jgi:DNA-binding IclR family transcriptional regulator
MEHFAEIDHAVRAIEISQAMQLNHSTTVQLLKTLVGAGYLLYNRESKTYYPSPRMVNFGLWLKDKYYGDVRIEEILTSISAATGEYVALFARNDIYMQVVEMRSPPNEVASAEVGVKVPLFGSACGAALLAEVSDSEIEALMERARVPAADRAELMDGLQLVRTEGYAFGGLSPNDDNRAIGMCLPHSKSGIPLVIGLGGPSARVEPRMPELVKLMRQTLDDWFVRSP